ncbi:MAG: hypothetical protein PUC73_10070, partial [Lachnospiraceae bacterium]|nr:hypothetical protein [Lachnospiraceae bacterium]
SPAGYFQHIVKKTSDESAEQFAKAYDKVISSTDAGVNESQSAEFSVEIGKSVRNLLEDATYQDFDWLEKVSFRVDADSTKEAAQTNMGLALNDKQLISLIILANLKEEKGYLQIPELNKSYLGMEFEELFSMLDIDMDDFNEVNESTEKVLKALPDKSKVEKIIKKYFDLAISCIDDVKQEKEKVTLEEVTNTYTVLEATIDEETLQSMLETIVKELKEDEDIKKIIMDVSATIEDADADDVYDEFLDALDDMEDEIDDLGDEKIEIVLKLYVDNKGEVYGTVVEIEEADLEVSNLMVRKGSKFAYEFEVKVNGVKGSLEGTGKMSGSKMSGDFLLKAAGMKLAELKAEDVQLKDLEDGYFNGTITVSLASSAAKLIENEVDDDFPFDIKKLNLKITSASSKADADCRISLNEGEKMLGAVSVTYKTGKADKIKFPADSEVVMIENESDLMDWAEDIDFDEFLESLEDKLDAGLMDLIEDAILDGFSGGFGKKSADDAYPVDDWDDDWGDYWE